MSHVGKNIRQIRTWRKMTQNELAEKIHTTRQTISNYETERSKPDIDTLKLLADALEVELTDVIYGSEPARDKEESRTCVAVLLVLASLYFAIDPTVDQWMVKLSERTNHWCMGYNNLHMLLVSMMIFGAGFCAARILRLRILDVVIFKKKPSEKSLKIVNTTAAGTYALLILLTAAACAEEIIKYWRTMPGNDDWIRCILMDNSPLQYLLQWQDGWYFYYWFALIFGMIAAFAMPRKELARNE